MHRAGSTELKALSESSHTQKKLSPAEGSWVMRANGRDSTAQFEMHMDTKVTLDDGVRVVRGGAGLFIRMFVVRNEWLRQRRHDSTAHASPPLVRAPVASQTG